MSYEDYKKQYNITSSTTSSSGLVKPNIEFKSPKATNTTQSNTQQIPTFKTLEEAQAYAKSNNMKTANTTIEAPKLVQDSKTITSDKFVDSKKTIGEKIYDNVIEPTNNFMANAFVGLGELPTKALEKYVGGTVYNAGQLLQGKQPLSFNEMQQVTNASFKNLDKTLNKGTKASNLGRAVGNVGGYMLGANALGGSALAYGAMSGINKSANTNDIGDIAVSTGIGTAFGALNKGISNAVGSGISKAIPQTMTNLPLNVLKNATAGASGMYGAGAITGEAENVYNLVRNKIENSNAREVDWLKPVWSDEALSNAIIGSIMGGYNGTKADLENARITAINDYNELGNKLNNYTNEMANAFKNGDTQKAALLYEQGQKAINDFTSAKRLGLTMNESAKTQINDLWNSAVKQSFMSYNPTTIGDGSIQMNYPTQQAIGTASTQQTALTVPQTTSVVPQTNLVKPQTTSDVPQLQQIKTPSLQAPTTSETTSENNPKKYTSQEITDIRNQTKQYRREYEKALRRANLTDGDKTQLDRLVKGEITLDEIPDKYNKDQIEKLYATKKVIYDNSKILKDIKKEVKANRMEEAKGYIEGSDNWKDKSKGIFYDLETAERNIYDIIGNTDQATSIVDNYISPVYEHEADKTRQINNYVAKVKSLDLSTKENVKIPENVLEKINKTLSENEKFTQTKLAEDSVVQLLGEKIIDKADVEAMGFNYDKIENAVNTIREIYNDIITQANDVLVRNGYEPVEYRKDYFPHFREEEPDQLLQKVAKKLGVSLEDQTLPTEIAGRTQNFRPGKKWSANILERKGNLTYFSALKGFDRYLPNMMDIINHTDDIQNLRSLSDTLRYENSDEEIKKRVDAILNNDELKDEEKYSLIAEMYRNTDRTKLSNFVNWLENYTNTLAGKKSNLDRGIEWELGRNIYTTAKNVEGRAAANMVGANLSSALTNFIPLFQASGEIPLAFYGEAAKQLCQNIFNDIIRTGSSENDGFVDRSTFLTTRRGTDKAHEEIVEKIVEILGKPMELIDDVVSETIVRARYSQNKSNGMSDKEAMKEADDFARGLIAGRGKGEKPLIFESKNPLIMGFTSFQLEQNNQYRYAAKDMKRRTGGFSSVKSGTKYVTAIAKMLVAVHLYNLIMKQVNGRAPATDPIDIVGDFVGDIGNDGIVEASKNLATNVAEELPFSSIITGGGRIPVSSAVPSVYNIAKSVEGLMDDNEANNKMYKEKLLKEAEKPFFYMVTPTAGGQLKKTFEGARYLANGGKYSYDQYGNKQLDYEADKGLIESAKALLFGPSGTKRGTDYYENGGLSKKTTQAYEQIKETGIGIDEFKNMYNAMNSINPKTTNSSGKEVVDTNQKKAELKEYLNSTNLTDEQKKIMYGMFYSVK